MLNPTPRGALAPNESLRIAMMNNRPKVGMLKEKKHEHHKLIKFYPTCILVNLILKTRSGGNNF